MENEEKEDKTILLRIINAIQIFACLISSVFFLINNEIIKGIMILIIGFVLLAFLKGFQDIIELLDKINNKLK